MTHRRAPIIGLLLLLAAAVAATPAVAEEDMILTSTPHSEWTLDIEYYQSHTVEGGSGEYTWEVSAGALPPGLELTEEGVLSGTPTTAGTYEFTLEVTDGFDLSDSKTCSMKINGRVEIADAVPSTWTAGSGFSRAFETAGGTGEITFSLHEGDLPEGITIDEDGTLSGTPEDAGTYTFTLKVEDSLGSEGTAKITFDVNAAPSLEGATVRAWTLNRELTADIAVAGGTAPFTWTVDGDLPEGVAGSDANSLYLLSGTPGQAGESEFTIEVEDATGATATRTVSLTINDWPTFETTDLSDWSEDHAFTKQLPVEGGTAPYTFRVTEGGLPSGISVDERGVLSGTPLEFGDFAFSLEVVDAAGATVVSSFHWNLNPAIEIHGPALPEWTAGVAIAPTGFTTEGGTGHVVFTGAKGLPAGITLGAAGALTGTPTESGTFDITITAADEIGAEDEHRLTWTINDAPAFAADDFADWTAGSAYDTTIAATGGTAPLTIELASGNVPDGLDLTLGAETVKLTGTPTVEGTYAFTIRITDAIGAEAVLAADVEINAAPEIRTAELPDWTAGHEFSRVIEISGGTAPLTVALARGTLPEGLTIAANGTLSGRPISLGDHEFALDVTDAAGARALAAFAMKISAAPAFAIEIPEWTEGVAFSKRLIGTGGTGELEWTVSNGSLPNGVGLAADGSLSGRPIENGSFTVKIRAADRVGAAAEHAFTWRVNPALEIETGTADSWTVGKYYQLKNRAAGGTAPFTWRMTSGSLPEGLGLIVDGEWAMVAGTPAAPMQNSFELSLTDGVGATAARSITVTINPELDDEFATDLVCAAGRPVDLTLPLSGGTAPYAVTLSDGTPLPTGLTVDGNTGRIIGRTFDAGAYPIDLSIRDAAGITTKIACVLHVADEVIFREKRSGALNEDDGAQYLFFDAIEGTQVDLTVQFGRGADLKPAVDVLTDGVPVNLPDGKMRTSSGKWSLKKFSVPTTGRYFVRIDNRAARYAGQVRIRSRAKLAKTVVISGTAEAPVNAGECDFYLLPGCRVSLDLDTSNVRIGTEDSHIVAPCGEIIFLSDDVADLGGSFKTSPSGSGAAITNLNLPAGGRYRLHVALSGEGTFKGRIRIKAPRKYRFVLDD